MKGTARFRTKRREPDSDFNITSPLVFLCSCSLSRVLLGDPAQTKEHCVQACQGSAPLPQFLRERDCHDTRLNPGICVV